METTTARTRMARRAGAVTKYITELTNAIEELDLATVEMRWINDVVVVWCVRETVLINYQKWYWMMRMMRD